MADKKCEHIHVEEHTPHGNHPHTHGKDCGHTAIVHKDTHGCAHTDFVHKDEKTGETHLHHACENGDKSHVHDCTLGDYDDAETGGLVTDCMGDFKMACWSDDDGICGGPDCKHEAIPHDGHNDYLVPSSQVVLSDKGLHEQEGFDVHCPHGGNHCDTRGFILKAPQP